jgi:SPX domain protein involved in polyphosphate accumulation
MNAGQQEALRYERKFFVSDYSYADIKQILHFHPSFFREIYQERRINNIYFDSAGMASYYDNLDGNNQRLKVRIRWYGDLFEENKKPVLEYKIKKGLLGTKQFFLLKPFTINEDFSREVIANASEDLPKDTRDYLLSLQPTLLNTYQRKYYLSGDGLFRVTVDHHLKYYAIRYGRQKFVNSIEDHNGTVVELKYESEHEPLANKVASAFPFAVTKNSKYMQGLDKILLYP